MSPAMAFALIVGGGMLAAMTVALILDAVRESKRRKK